VRLGLGIGDWRLGIGDWRRGKGEGGWGLGIGDWGLELKFLIHRIMRKAFLISVLIFSFLHSGAQMQMEDRMNLQNLLAERAKNFSEYTSSIQKRSGIFGNKTKSDIKKSNEVLLAIVTLDNDIMDALNRALSYKTFEKTTDNYSSRDCELQLKNSMQVTDTLMKQLALVEKKMKQRNNSASLYTVLFYLVLATSIIMFIMLKRKKA
jgi:hypothetical protein